MYLKIILTQIIEWDEKKSNDENDENEENDENDENFSSSNNLFKIKNLDF